MSPGKDSWHSTVCCLEQPACLWLWIVEDVQQREGDQPKPEPVIPLCLLRLQTAQISHEAYPAGMHSFVSLPPFPRLGGEGGGGGECWHAIASTSPVFPSGRYKVEELTFVPNAS